MTSRIFSSIIECTFLMEYIAHSEGWKQKMTSTVFLIPTDSSFVKEKYVPHEQ
jgi:hypothetical protein